MFKKLKLFLLWLSYKTAEMRNVYSHKAVGQRQRKDGITLIMYTILGKRDLYDVPINELMDNKALLERFHPCQTAKFGAIALGDVLFSLPQDQRENRYKNIKDQMLPPDDENNQPEPEDKESGSEQSEK